MRKLKLLTLNLHCLEEENIKQKQQIIIDEIVKKEIDIIFLQEVAQFADNQVILNQIKESNYAYELQQALSNQNKEYLLYFEPIKHSFGKYDEGLAILSKYPLENIEGPYISKSKDYYNWKCRKLLKGDMIRLDKVITFTSVHLGWSDGYEIFEDQFDKLIEHLDNNHVNIIAGDFNVSPKTKEYAYLLNKGFKDLYGSIPKYLFDPTHEKDIDLHIGQTRIDYIFSNVSLEVLSREVLFKKNRVSDHYGVYLEIRV